MANFNGVQSALIAAGAEPFATQVGGRVRVFHETFTYATQAAASTITVASLPPGAQILGFELTTDTSTGSATLSVGTAASAALYVAAAAYTSVNTQTVLPLKVAGVTAAGVATPLTAQTNIILTTAAASLPAAGTLLFDTYYTLD